MTLSCARIRFSTNFVRTRGRKRLFFSFSLFFFYTCFFFLVFFPLLNKPGSSVRRRRECFFCGVVSRVSLLKLLSAGASPLWTRREGNLAGNDWPLRELRRRRRRPLQRALRLQHPAQGRAPAASHGPFGAQGVRLGGIPFRALAVHEEKGHAMRRRVVWSGQVR